MTEQQKRALGIGGVGIAGVLLWQRTRSKKRAQTAATPVSTTGSIAPYTPQNPVTLQPGESIYDPNTQGLLTTPTPIDTTSVDAGAGNQTSSPAAPAYTVNVNYPTTVKTVRAAKKPVKRPVKKAKAKVNK